MKVKAGGKRSIMKQPVIKVCLEIVTKVGRRRRVFQNASQCGSEVDSNERSLQHVTPEQSATAAEAGASQNNAQGGSQVNSDELGVSHENVAGQLFISDGIRIKRD